MRTTGLVLFSLASASTLVAAKPAEAHNRNSLESLLDRFASHKNGTASSSVKVVEPTAVSKNETRPAPAVEKKPAPKEEDAPSDKMVKRNRAKKNEENAKRWVWSTAVIQDDTPNAPPVGVNVNQLNRPAVAVTTPAAKLVAPSFAAPASKAAATTAAALVRKPFHQVHGVRVDEAEHKRWIWANSVIQDDTPASEVPPIGENADLLGDAAYTRTTPAATLVRPTFPPLSSSSSQTPPAALASLSSSSSSSSSAAPTSTIAPVVAVDAAAATPVVAAGPTSTPAPTSSAHHWWNPKDFFHDVEAGFDKLFHIHHSSTSAASATAAPVVSTTEIEKRWVWATGVIQDDTPNAPPIGANANLLNSAAAPVNTPAATLVAPSFPPVAAFSAQTPRAIAAVAAAAPSSSSSSSAPAAHTTPAVVNRTSWKSVHDALLAASSSSAAAASSSAAAAAAQTPVAAPVVRMSYTAAQRFAAAQNGATPARMAKAKRNEA
ncbi:hypothetical protein JCM10449v2_007672 [Rhodotorula kratochvilovae]